jgi:hypothetical protein
MNIIKMLCPMLLAATLALIHAQTDKDQPAAKAAEQELADKATKLNVEGFKLY